MSEPQYVYSRDGRRGVIIQDRDPENDDRRFLKVRFEDGAELRVPVELLEPRADGGFTLEVGYADVERAAGAAPRGAADARTVGALETERVVVPVVAEELRVDTRTVDTGVVRVRKIVHEREELVDQPVVREEVQIERVPIGRMVDVTPEPRQEGDTLVIPVLEEVLVVEKRVRLKEEVRVTRRRLEEQGSQRVVLRSEEVVVERDNPATSEAGQ